jgi:hypothetical protein
MNAKKLVGFLLLRPAFTQRNFTSIFLVCVFAAVYIMMGGKVTTGPASVKNLDGFGGVSLKDQQSSQESESEVEEGSSNSRDKKLEAVLGAKPSSERVARGRANLGWNKFSEEEQEAKEAPLDKEGLIQGSQLESSRRQEAMFKYSEKKPGDSLSSIEERLNIKRD